MTSADASVIDAQPMQKAVNEYLQHDASQQAQSELVGGIVDEINSKRGTIAQLVELLGVSLSSEDSRQRARSTELLALVIDQVESLSPAKVPVLARFFGERLGGAPADIVPSLKGIMILMQKYSLPGSVVAADLQTLLTQVDIQKHSQTIRSVFFRFLKLAVVHHSADIRALMGSQQFIIGLVRAVDGEKDPRNLLVTFKLAQLLPRLFEFGTDLAEDVFEISACYFPITFRPPPNDPYGITAEDLKRELRLAMTVSPLFTAYAMPLIMEKMASENLGAKKDAFDTLAHGAAIFGRFAVAAEWNEIWKHIKNAVETADEQLVQSAFALLRSVFKSVAPVETSSSMAASSVTAQWAAMLSTVYTDSRDKMKQAETKNGRLFSRLLAVAACATPASFAYITVQWIPGLLTADNMDYVAKRVFIEVLLDVFTLSRELEFAAEHPLSENRAMILESVLTVIESQDVTMLVKTTALQTLVSIIKVPRFTDGFDFADIKRVVVAALFDTCWEHQLQLVAQTLAAVERQDPSVISEVVARLSGPFADQAVDDYIKIMHVTAVVCRQENYLSLLLPHLIQSVTVLLGVQNEGADGVDGKLSCALETLTSIIAGNKTNSIPAVDQFTETFLDSQLNECGNHLQSQPQIVKLLSVAAQRHGSQEILADKAMSVLTATMFSPKCDAFALQVVGAVLGNINAKKLQSILSQYSDIEERLLELGLESNDQALIEPIGMLIAIFSNQDPTRVPRVFAKLQDAMAAQGSDSAVQLCVWLGAGQVIRSSGEACITFVVEQLSHPQLGAKVAEHFSTLIADHVGILSRGSGAQIRLLYKQKFFALCLPLIYGGYRSADEATRGNFLVALAGIIKFCPEPLLMENPESILPMIYASLVAGYVAVNESAIAALGIIIRNNKKAILGDVAMITKSLLQLADYHGQVNSMSVRIGALQTLGEVAKLPYDVLYPHKAGVVRSLLVNLDDPKRLVRKEAVECRNKWFLIESTVVK